MLPSPRLTSHEEALIAVGRLCEALANQDVEPQVRWDMTIQIEAGRVALAISLDKPVTVDERDLMLQAASRIASLTKSNS